MDPVAAYDSALPTWIAGLDTAGGCDYSICKTNFRSVLERRESFPAGRIAALAVVIAAAVAESQDEGMPRDVEVVVESRDLHYRTQAC
jgi:hypothetical protein